MLRDLASPLPAMLPVGYDNTPFFSSFFIIIRDVKNCHDITTRRETVYMNRPTCILPFNNEVGLVLKILT